MPVMVTGPDNRQYQFPDGTDKAAAVKFFKKKGIGAPTAQQAETKQPGFLTRYAQGVGIPTTSAEASAFKPTVASVLGGPPLMAAKMATSAVKNLAHEGQAASTELTDATENILSGQPVKPNLGKAVGAVTKFGLRGVLGPVGGDAVQTGGEDVANKNYSGASGDALAALTNLLLLKGGSGASDTTRVNKLAYAAGGEATPIEHTLSDLRQTATEHGEPKTVGDMLKTVNKTKDRMNAESGAAMLPIAGRKLVPTAISDRIKSLITPNMDQTAAGRAEKSAILRAAADFEKPWTYQALDAERMSARSRLRSFNSKNPVEQYIAKGAFRSVAIDDAINKAIREAVYPEMDKAAGKPPGYFASLKGRQSQLIDLESVLHDRVEKLKNDTAKIKGAPRFSRENMSAHVSGSGRPGLSIYGLTNLIKKPNPLGSADAAVKAGFKDGSAIARAGVVNLPAYYLLEAPQQQSVASALGNGKHNSEQK